MIAPVRWSRPCILSAATLLTVGLCGCTRSTNGEIVNDLSFAAEITMIGPGECGRQGEPAFRLAPSTEALVRCDMRSGMTIRLRRAAGQACTAAPPQVTRAVHVYWGDLLPPFLRQRVRLSALQCWRG